MTVSDVRTAPPAIECRQLLKVYPARTGRVQAIRGIDLQVEPGSTTAIVGPSGSGKSSLLRMVAALEEPTAGSVEIFGSDLFALGSRRRARRRGEIISHVHQRPSDNLLSHLTAHQILSRLRRAHTGATEDEALELFGLSHRRDHLPAMMSGGEQQRLAVARALVAGHGLVLADEPTAQLDPAGAESVLGAIELLAGRGVTVVVATHDPRVLPRMDQVVTLRDGSVASVTESGNELAVIDRSGRLQLPPEVRSRFDEHRARIEWDPTLDVLKIHRP